MVWLFLSVLLVVVVYLAIQFPAFRKAIGVCLAVLFIAVVVGAGWLYYMKIEGDKRVHLIHPDELVFTDTVLVQTYRSWKVKGKVTNRSSHELSNFTLTIKVQDCPVSGDRCTTVGEHDVSVYLSVPPNQMRAFEDYVGLHDMPELTKWGWTYTVQEVRANVK
jgi:hypothetical protein